MATGDSAFTYKAIMFGIAVLLLMPMMIGIFAPANMGDVDQDELLSGYEDVTGQTASPKTSVWVLTGIYLPFSGTVAGHTEDNWLHGGEIKSYSPHQYLSTPQEYTVTKGTDGVFRYAVDSNDYDEARGLGHAKGDLYTRVNFDDTQKSSIFFSEAGRSERDGFFYYSYDGYRLAFQPVAGYTALTQDGERVPVIPTTTSLSLIWYQYYTQSGISGNLVLSGNQSGISYLNSAMIVSAFNHNTSSAYFDMVFNGITMGIIITIDPIYLANGYTVEECYNAGWWSIMVTSQSADSSAYTGTDFAMNPMKLLDIMWDLFTFDFAKYNMSAWLGMICSIFFALPLYAMLLTIMLDKGAKLYIAMGVMLAVQGISAAMSIFG